MVGAGTHKVNGFFVQSDYDSQKLVLNLLFDIGIQSIGCISVLLWFSFNQRSSCFPVPKLKFNLLYSFFEFYNMRCFFEDNWESKYFL